MHRQLPYDVSYETLNCWRKIETALLWCTFISPILYSILQIPYFHNNLCIIDYITSFLSFFNYFSVIGYGGLYIAIEIIMQPMVAQERRKGLLDNSIGTNFLARSVTNYYDNDEISYGMYKLLVNCFENCYFTYHIVKRMLLCVILKNITLGFLLSLIAYLGIMSSFVFIPIIQLFISSLFLYELAYHISFFFRLKRLYEQFQYIFQRRISKKEAEKDAIYMVLEYEAALAYNKSPNSDSVYNKMREQLTAEWIQIKERYRIQ